MSIHKYADKIFYIIGVLLAFFYIYFEHRLNNLWEYGVIFSATTLIFIGYLIHAQTFKFYNNQNPKENELKEMKGSSHTITGWFLNLGVLPTLFFVFLLCAIFIILSLPTPLAFLQDQDWSYQLAGANQILKGQHPFISSIDFYGPLTFYSSALLQIIFDTRVIGEIILITLGYSIAYTIIFWLMWSLCQDKSLSLILVIIIIILIPKLYKYYIVLGPALSLLSIWKYLDDPSYKKLWLVSMTVVLTGLFRSDFGAYMTLTTATAIFLRTTRIFTVRQKLIDLLYFCGTLIILASPWLIFVTMGGGLRDYLYYSTIGGAVAGSGMSLPLSFSNDLFSLQNLESMVTIVFNLIPGFALIIMLHQRHKLDTHVVSKLTVLILASQLTLIQGWHRTGWEHLLQAIPTTFILFAYLFKRIKTSFWRKSRFVSLISLGLGIGLLSSMLIYRLPNLGKISVTRTLDDLKVYSLHRDQFTELLIKQYPNSPLLGAMNFIRTCSKPDDKIIAWPYLIDFYYFTDRPLGGRLQMMAPVFSDSDQEEAIVREMESDNIAFYIFRPKRFSPTMNNIRDYAPIIFNYLEETYVPVQQFDKIIIHINNNRQLDIDCRGQ